MKMHGLGNDFVVVDHRDGDAWVDANVARALGDRHRGVGFDQLAVIEKDATEDLRLTFYNPDGSISAACGNATRCIARHEMDQTGRSNLKLRTDRGVLEAEIVDTEITRVNLGQPFLEWADIPLAHDTDTLHLPIEGDPVATGMGNPHCTFFVADAEAVNLAIAGPQFEAHPLYPERTNVEFAHLEGPDTLRLRIWERGTGVTLASGSCSAATAVAAARRGLTGRRVTVNVDGGQLGIDWRDDGVWMSGPTTVVFSGVIPAEFFRAD